MFLASSKTLLVWVWRMNLAASFFPVYGLGGWMRWPLVSLHESVWGARNPSCCLNVYHRAPPLTSHLGKWLNLCKPLLDLTSKMRITVLYSLGCCGPGSKHSVNVRDSSISSNMWGLKSRKNLLWPQCSHLLWWFNSTTSLGVCPRSFKGGGVPFSPANRNSNPVQGTPSISLSPPKPDAVNSEQTPPRRCDYEIPVSFMSHLSVSLTFPFFSYNLIFATIYQMWSGTSHFIYNLSLFGSRNLGKWNSCLLPFFFF